MKAALAKLSMRLDGAAAAIKSVDGLGKKLGTKIVRNAIRGGAKITLAKAKALAPVDTGLLKKRLKIKTMKRKKGRIGLTVATSTKEYTGKTFYAPMVEFGHKVGKRPGRGAKAADTRKEVPGEHFIDRAFKTTRREAKAFIIEDIKKKVAEEARKSAVKATALRGRAAK